MRSRPSRRSEARRLAADGRSGGLAACSRCARSHAPWFRRVGAAASTTNVLPTSVTGRFLNPVLSGDHPDPAILKDGEDYYATFSSFDAGPGLVIWHSRDLVNWQPLKAVLQRYLGSVWAPSLHKDGGRFLLYFPVKATINDIYVTSSNVHCGPVERSDSTWIA